MTDAGRDDQPEAAAAEREVLADAAEIAGWLRELRRHVEQPQDEAARAAGLTMPQISALSALFDHGPLSLKDLSRELGLSHSTVSGIVDRLERRGLARRTVDPDDRRVSRIAVTEEVNSYARAGYAQSQAGSLLPGLRAASADQRRSIKAALTLLHALVADQPSRRA